jgi:hypothetical protein
MLGFEDDEHLEEWISENPQWCDDVKGIEVFCVCYHQCFLHPYSFINLFASLVLMLSFIFISPLVVVFCLLAPQNPELTGLVLDYSFIY